MLYNVLCLQGLRTNIMRMLSEKSAKKISKAIAVQVKSSEYCIHKRKIYFLFLVFDNRTI